MFCIDAMISTCKCCGHTVTVSCMISSTQIFRCAVCDHANTITDSFTTVEMEELMRKKQEEEIKKYRAR